MTLQEKYTELRRIFFAHFIYMSSNTKCRGTNIPASSIRTDAYGNVTVSFGDGTINMAEYLQFLFSDKLNKEPLATSRMKYALESLNRLSLTFLEDMKMAYPKYKFTYERGFFLRDDVSKDSVKLFEAFRIESGYSNGIEMENEDPCFSPFASQDQIWNLAPILAYLSEYVDRDGVGQAARWFLADTLKYVIDHAHTIYNPYYSTVKHYWTYVPTLNEDKVKHWERDQDRQDHLKYDVKVKRGANNWYFAAGFRAIYEELGMDRFSGLKDFIYKCIYYPTIFIADKVWFPILRKRKKEIKDNSFYCMSCAGNIWYGSRKNFLKRTCEFFNKDTSHWNVAFLEAIKQKDFSYIDFEKLKKWLEEYEFDSKNMESPIKFLTLYNYCQMFDSALSDTKQ